MNRVLRSYSIHELYSTRKARKSEAISSKSNEKKIRRYHPLKYLDVIYSPLSNEFTAFITLYCIIKQLLPTLWWYAAVPLVWISCQFNVYILLLSKIIAVFFVWLCMVWLWVRLWLFFYLHYINLYGWHAIAIWNWCYYTILHNRNFYMADM